MEPDAFQAPWLGIGLLAALGVRVLWLWLWPQREIDDAKAYLDKEFGRAPDNLDIARDHVLSARWLWTALLAALLIIEFNL